METNRIPCLTCNQVDDGQTGEYPCPECGLPRMHDERIRTDVLFREAGDIINGDGTYVEGHEPDNPLNNLIALQEVLDPGSEHFEVIRDDEGEPIGLLFHAF